MTNQTILIADDDSDLVELLARRCRSQGFGVDTAGDALTALRKIDQLRPALVILDVNMPGGNGLSVREMMADNEQLASIPVIILTGKSDEQILRRCFESCAYYVAKCPDVWPRIQPLLTEILGGEDQAGGPSDIAPAATVNANPYEQSDQKVFFDWIFDMLAEPETNVTESLEPDLNVTESLEPDLNVTESLEPESSAEGISLRPVEDPWVMCIDDDSEFTFSLQMRLQEHGVNVLRAFSGMEGFRNTFFSGPRAVILDFEMPDGNGDYVLRRLKETPLTQNIPIIVLTGRKDCAVERTMYNLGANKFLTKPCSWEKLWSTLQPYLEPCVV